MPRYKIADVIFEANLIYPYTEKLCRSYLYVGTDPVVFTADMKQEDIAYEKAIFTSAYIVRKLFEASKLSYKLKEISCPIKKYPNIKHVNLFNWHNIDQVFDLNNPAKHSLNIKKLCNYLIHSFIFILSWLLYIVAV